MRAAVACILGFSTAATAQPAGQRPITELDVYEGIAEFWRLAGLEEGFVVRLGGGVNDDHAIGTVDISYRANWRGWRELLPNNFAIGGWTDGTVPLSIGWQLDLGIFSAPYVVANAIATPDLAFGFDVGIGYEHRARIRWGLAVDLRFHALWPTSDDQMSSGEPYGARASIALRRYFD